MPSWNTKKIILFLWSSGKIGKMELFLNWGPKQQTHFLWDTFLWFDFCTLNRQFLILIQKWVKIKYRKYRKKLKIGSLIGNEFVYKIAKR